MSYDELDDAAAHDWDERGDAGERWFDSDRNAHEGSPPNELDDDDVYPFGYWFDAEGHLHVRARAEDPLEAAYYRKCQAEAVFRRKQRRWFRPRSIALLLQPWRRVPPRNLYGVDG
jgi:hypothetical protein